MKKGKRAKTKNPALKPELNLRSRYELIDYDYVSKLSEEDKAWLNKFTEEYINANLNREDLSKNFHNTKELKQDCDRRNNARNRDILTQSKASGGYISFDEMILNKKTILIDFENDLLDVVDNFVDDSKETSN